MSEDQTQSPLASAAERGVAATALRANQSSPPQDIRQRVGAAPRTRQTLGVEILGICASLQRQSANRALLAEVVRALPAGVVLTESDHITRVPYFNPDLDGDYPPDAVAEFRAALARADAVAITCTEYAYSIPGALKNALDWIVGSGELYGKPVLLASAGTSGGARALDALTQTLKAQGSLVVARVSVAGARTKIDAEGRVHDAATREAISEAVDALVASARVVA